MKRYISLFLFCVVMDMNTSALAAPFNILTTTADLRSITEFIGGDKVHVESLAKGTENYHFLAAKPSYMMKANKADLFICNGLDLEIGYESLLLEGSRNPKIQKGRPGYVDASEGIVPLEVPRVLDRALGDIHPLGNPHYWLDPLNAKIVARNIAQSLMRSSPNDIALFKDNLRAFDDKIDAKMKIWQRELAPYQGEKIITYHQSWPYFARRFGFVIAGQLEPKPGVPPSPSHLQGIVDLVEQENIRVILQENIYKTDAAQYVAVRTGAQVVAAPISVDGVKEAEDYFSLMDIIVRRLAEALKI